MQFVYHPNAGDPTLIVDVREYEHIFKVRRLNVEEILHWRNLVDSFIYDYRIVTIGKKEAQLALVAQNESKITPFKSLHIGWSIIDPKIIEKTLPMLNELGVEKISFVYADFSQKNHKLDFDRMKRILINSSQQCGRSTLMKVEVMNTLESYLKEYPQSFLLDFTDQKIEQKPIQSILIGPEGGFSQRERESMKNHSVVGLECQMILRSETAVVTVASKILA